MPFLGTAALLLALEPLSLPVALACVAHAWIIPELYAQRGANVVRPKPARADAEAERVALGLLGDLVGHDARDLHAPHGPRAGARQARDVARGPRGRVARAAARAGCAACACTASACA